MNENSDSKGNILNAFFPQPKLLSDFHHKSFCCLPLTHKALLSLTLVEIKSKSNDVEELTELCNNRVRR